MVLQGLSGPIMLMWEVIRSMNSSKSHCCINVYFKKFLPAAEAGHPQCTGASLAHALVVRTADLSACVSLMGNRGPSLELSFCPFLLMCV